MPKYHCLANRLGTFLSLDKRTRALIVEAAILPILIRVGFRLFGVPGTQTRLRKWSGRKTVTAFENIPEIIADARRAQRAVKRAAGIGGSCLVRSLTLWAILRRHAVPTELRVGVRKLQDKVEAHAWIEYEGRPINEEPSVVSTYSAYPEPIVFDAMPWSG